MKRSVFATLMVSALLSFGISACSDDTGSDDSGILRDHGIGDDASTDQGGQRDLPPAAPGFELAHSGKAIPNGGSYLVPDNMAAGAVAIFSEQKDLMTIKNTGTASMTLTSIEITGTSADAKDEEWKICESSSPPHACKTYTLGALEAGKTFDFYLHFFPVASGSRPATLTIKYKNASGDQVYTAKIDGKGRVGSDKAPAKLLTAGTLAMHKLWGGYGNSQDEYPGTMVADASGNIYFAGTGTGLVGSATSGDRNIFVVKVKADKSLGFAKLYHSSAHDQITSIDYGNTLTGAADAMTMDSKGNIYLTGMAGNGTNKTVLLVMKIDPADGKAIWTRYWFGDASRLKYTDAAKGFAIDVSNDLVFITGKAKTASDQGMPVIAMGTDGTLKWSKIIVPRGKGSSAHEGHAIRADGKGNLYIAGIDKGTNGGAFLAKLKGVDATGTNVSLDWAIDVTGSPVGTNFNSMDVDAQGNVFLAMDRRGASAFFSVLKVSPDGKTIVGKTIPSGDSGDGGGSWDNIYVVRVVGTSVYAGGRIQATGWDTGKGDGMIAKFATSDMKLGYAALYYTGSGPNQVCAHSTHGVAVNGKDLYLMGQVYSGNKNHYRYWGYWYDYPYAAVDFSPPSADVSTATTLGPMAKAALVSATSHPTDFKNDGAYDDIDASMNVEFQDAKDKNESTHGAQVDSDIFVMKLTEK